MKAFQAMAPKFPPRDHGRLDLMLRMLLRTSIGRLESLWQIRGKIDPTLQPTEHAATDGREVGERSDAAAACTRPRPEFHLGPAVDAPSEVAERRTRSQW